MKVERPEKLIGPILALAAARTCAWLLGGTLPVP